MLVKNKYNKLSLAKVEIYEGSYYSSYVSVTNIITNLDNDTFMIQFKKDLKVAKEYLDNGGEYDSKDKPKYTNILLTTKYHRITIDNILDGVTFTELKSGYIDHAEY